MQQDKRTVCSVVVNSTRDELFRVYDSILACLKEHRYSEEDQFGIHLALEEAFVNAIEHGNKNDPQKKVKVECTVDTQKFEVRVEDEGYGFNPENVPDPREEKNLYKANGRGLLLMRAYMDVVEYSERGNEVHMIKYRSANIA